MAKTYYKMRLKEVMIGGYKSIAADYPVQLKLNGINILLGANGAGKSNIISFFTMLSYLMNKSFGAYVAKAGGANSLLYYGVKHTPVISGRLVFSNKKNEDIYSFSLAYAAPDRLVVTEESLTWQRKGEIKPYQVVLKPNFNESSLADSNDPVAKSIYWLLSYCKVYQFHDSSAEGPLRQACSIETSNYLQTHGNNLPSFLLFLRDHYNDSYRRIVSYVSDVIPQFQDFYLEPVGNSISLRWVDNSATDYRFNAHQLSDGAIRFIALATLLLQSPKTMPDVIIIDEPELGLHPYAISQLAEMIRDASKHAQIIISTQSKDLVDYFDIDNITIVEMDDANQCTKASVLDKNKYRLWLDHYSLSEIWDKNIIGGRPI